MKNSFLITDSTLKAPLSQSIQKEYNALIETILSAQSPTKEIQDLISYQIGWGILLLSWYQAGVDNKTIQMPGAGFNTWDYKGLAEHFYQEYEAPLAKQLKQFYQIASQIINIVEKEYANGNLRKLGVWKWCTLKSGKQWPLQKWIQVNTVAPYKRARLLINKKQ